MPTTATNLSDRLASVVGVDRIENNTAALSPYAIDEHKPSIAVKPATAQETAEVVRFALQENLAIIPCGSRSKLQIGNIPARYDIALDMTALNQIAHYDPGDLTVSIDAGCTLKTIAATLNPQNQFLPLPSAYGENATVAGTIASGVDSHLRQFYGTARDFLVGAEFIDGTGAQCKSGGRVVKNVTGYDLHKLLIGSLGTLGIITRLNFRTFPLPEGYGHVVSTFSSVDSIVRFQAMVSKSPLSPSSFEILGPEAAQVVAGFQGDRDSALPSWFTQGTWHVCVGLEGVETVLRRYSAELMQYAEQCGASSGGLLEKSTEKSLRSGLRELIKLLSRSGPAATIFRINTFPGFSADVAMLDALAARFLIPSCVFATSSGPLYFALQPDDLNDKTITSLAQIASGVFEYAAAHNGSAFILFCPTALKRVINVWGRARNDAALMRRVKNAFDPANIFAPGRFVGGI